MNKLSFLRLLAYAACVWISNKYAAGYWVVGPVFGGVVILHDLKNLKNFQIFKYPVYFILSTLIYALVYRVALLNWGNNNNDLFVYFIGSFSAAIVLGSVLMSVTHTLVFNKTKDMMASAIIRLVGAYYLLVVLSYINDKSKLGWEIPWMTLMIVAWQGLYLHTFFSKVK